MPANQTAISYLNPPSGGFKPQVDRSLPSYQSNYYDPGSGYGLPQQVSSITGPYKGFFDQTVFGPTGFLEQNPDVAYGRFSSNVMNQTNPGANSPQSQLFSDYMKSRATDVYSGYQQATVNNPALMFQEFLNSLSGSEFLNQWKMLHPSQRGEQPSRFGGGRMQWLIR